MFRFWMLCYAWLYSLAALLYLPFFLLRVVARSHRRIHLLQRAGRIPDSLCGRADSGPAPLWIHAVSVGEVNAVRPLVRALEKDYPLFLSTTTDTGQRLARSLFSNHTVFYFPLDWQWVCRRYLGRVRPAAVLIAETEIWPGFLAAAHRQGIPILLINGRLSARSFRRYRRIRFFLKPVLNRFARCCMQTRPDRDRLIELGAEPERVNWVGNLKYDYRPAEQSEGEKIVEQAQQLLKPAAGDLLWICGSTREQEEELLAGVYLNLCRSFPRLRLLIAPRHTHRAAEIVRLLQSRDIQTLRRSELPPSLQESAGLAARALVLDSIGELPYIYGLADVVFMGGSLVPTGGHNLIEAAFFGKPILFGPHMSNFREIADTFTTAYAALQVSNAAELEQRIRDLLGDPDARAWLGRNARKVVRENQGALERTLELITPHLKGNR